MSLSKKKKFYVNKNQDDQANIYLSIYLYGNSSMTD